MAVVLDFPEQVYIDGTTFERKYVRRFEDAETRAVDMARLALDELPELVEPDRRRSRSGSSARSCRAPSYKGDRAGALRLTRLMLNELHFPLSNAVVWVEDEQGRRAGPLPGVLRLRLHRSLGRGLVLDGAPDALLPRVEKELCQGFVDSILAEDPTPRLYHFHASFVEARKHFPEHPEEYEGESMTQIRDAFKIKGSVAHDVGAMPKGHPLRNVSDYAWYNNNYWVDLFPKLAHAGAAQRQVHRRPRTS